MARLVPLRAARPRVLGMLRGKIRLAPDFDEPTAALVELFEGS